MTIDRRLQRFLHDEAAAVDADPDQAAWAAVQHGVRRRRTARTTGLALAAAALVAVVVGVGALVLGGDGEKVSTSGPANEPGEASTTTTAPSTTSTTTTAQPAALFPGIYPFASQAEVDAYVASPGTRMFFDPEATALEFAREYLKMPRPVRVKGAGGDTEIVVTPKAGSPIRTTIQVADVGDGSAKGPFTVVGAKTKNINVTQPASGAAVTSPAAVRGTSTAYEATVFVEVREDGGARLSPDTFVMGGANGEFGPFSGQVAFRSPTKPAGAIVFLTESAEDGTATEATVVRVSFAAAAAGTTKFSVFFHRDERLVEVRREVPQTAGVLRAALDSLFAGPRPEDGEGVTSLFSDKTKGLLAGVTLRPDGTAVIDLSDTVPNASSSTGSTLLLESLNATAFQFSTVKRVEYRLKGSCDAFWQWLQYGKCQVVERPAR